VRVLIVDDSAIVRERLADLLSERAGALVRVDQAEDIAGGLQSIRTLEPDVVILDIQMPGGSGIEVLRALKKERPKAKAIILTNYPYPQYRKRCLEAGADFFLDKSSEFDKVPRIIGAWIDRASGQ
jgi:DNA-binding NarL/FixJ family response regulator